MSAPGPDDLPGYACDVATIYVQPWQDVPAALLTPPHLSPDGWIYDLDPVPWWPVQEAAPPPSPPYVPPVPIAGAGLLLLSALVLVVAARAWR